MYELNLANNITRLRHEHKITQEELADFLGVTKASVSKWENAQSTPDLMLLLGLASFFDVTVDRLLGYEPRLSREQIRRYYAELSRILPAVPSKKSWKKYVPWLIAITPVIRSFCSSVPSIGTTICWRKRRKKDGSFWKKQ